MQNEKSKRKKGVALVAALFIICGTAYGILVSVVHFGIPCIFHEITGLKCPGCGITGGIVRIMHFDFYGAFQSNAFLFLIIPYVLLVFIHTSKEYILTGKYKLGTGKNLIDITFLILLVLWGIFRNIL